MPWVRSTLLSLLLIATGCLAASAGDGSGGMASFYPGIGASGEFTAAHRSLPFGTRVRVTRVGSGKSVIVRINDRGPFIAGRVIDISRRAAEELQMISAGVARVTLEVVQTASTTERMRSDPRNGIAQKKIKYASARHHQGRATKRSARLKHHRPHQARRVAS